MTDDNLGDPPKKSEESFRFRGRTWSGAELLTMCAFALLGAMLLLLLTDPTETGGSAFALVYMYAGVVSLVSLANGVRWALVKVIPISWIPLISWGIVSSLVGSFVGQPELIDNEPAGLIVVGLMLVVPMAAVLPFALPFRRWIASKIDAVSRMIDAFARTRVGRGLIDAVRGAVALGALLVASVVAVVESLAGILAGLLGLIFVIWLIKTIWYLV